MMKLLSTIIFSFIVIPAYADPSYYCAAPHNNVVSLDALDSDVKDLCGTPKAIKKIKKPLPQSVTLNTWTYFPKQSLSHRKSLKRLSYVKVLLIEQKVHQIQNYMPWFDPYAPSCFINSEIQVGDPAEKLLDKCGPPNRYNTHTESILVPTEVEEWRYNNGAFQPDVGLYFQDGKLIKIEAIK